MDHEQQHIQLAHPAWLGSSATQPHEEDDARLIDMCPSLYRAVHGGWMDQVMDLLQQHGAPSPDNQGTGIISHVPCDILEASAEGNTVLHIAARYDHEHMIRELCRVFSEKEGLLSRRNSTLDTPLHCAARAGCARAVFVLIQLAQERGEDILGCRNEAGDTALHLAARHGHGAAVEVLVLAAPATGAASELNNAGVSPLYLSVVSGSQQAVGAITSYCRDASAAGPGGQNALHAAVFQSLEMVRQLLQWRPALADEVDCNGSTPLHFAASDGDLPVVHAILSGGPPRTAYRKDHIGGLSALHVAARMGHVDVAKELLRVCPDAAELVDDGGGTFLHAAAKEKRSAVVSFAVKDPMLRRLLNTRERDGNMLRGLLNTRDRDGNTPLHLAVAAGAPEVVDILLRKGKVQADVLNDDGQMPFDLAKKSTSFFTMVRLVLVLVYFRAQSGPQRQDHLKPWSGRDIWEGIEKSSNSLSVVAGLVVAAAFAAGFQVPGSYDDNGIANLKDDVAFEIFVAFNSVAVAASVVTVVLLVYGRAMRSSGSWKSFIWALHCFWISVNSLMLAFYFGLTAVTKESNRFALVGIYLCMQVLAYWTVWPVSTVTIKHLWHSKCLWRSRLKTRQHTIVKRQYPLSAASALNLILFLGVNYVVTFGIGIFFDPSIYRYLNGKHNSTTCVTMCAPPPKV